MRVSLSPQFKAKFDGFQARGYFRLTQPIIIAKTRSLAFVPHTGPFDQAMPRELSAPIFPTTESLAAYVAAQNIPHAQTMARQIRKGSMPLYQGSLNLQSNKAAKLRSLAQHFQREIDLFSSIGITFIKEDIHRVPLYLDLWPRAEAQQLPTGLIPNTYGLTHIGDGTRLNNEDFYIIDKDILILCDGMGGHAAGEVAAEMAARVVYYCLQTGLNFEQAIFLANHEVNKFNQANNKNAGTTIVAVKLDGSTANFAHVGDSRLYLFKADGSYRQLMQDHTLTAQFQSIDAKYAHVLTRAIGAKDEEADTDLGSQVLEPNDILLLCSDGLSDPLADDDIAQIIFQGKSLQDTAEDLFSAAIATGKAKDNITFAFYRYPSAN